MQETFHARFCSFCQVFLVTLRQKKCPRTREKPLYPGNLAILFTSELQKWTLQLSEDKVAEFLTKTERKKFKITQSILLNGCFLCFARKHLLNILKPCQETGLRLDESLRGGKIC